jgi:hypothetical protein
MVYVKINNLQLTFQVQQMHFASLNQPFTKHLNKQEHIAFVQIYENLKRNTYLRIILGIFFSLKKRGYFPNSCKGNNGEVSAFEEVRAAPREDLQAEYQLRAYFLTVGYLISSCSR